MSSRLPSHSYKPRVFILTDISNEPDDAESLCRYLLYSNQFYTRGLVACTSTWMRGNVHAKAIEQIVSAFGETISNLNNHVSPDMQYPTVTQLLDVIQPGIPVYGRAILSEPLCDAARMLISRVDESSEPLWVLCWGGPNILAQALNHVHETEKRSPEEAKKFRDKLRIYATSDQDDTGPWMRRKYPDVFYIASVHAWNEYGLAAWTGISGDKFYNFDQGGPDFTKLEKPWIKEHIQLGPLGKQYPDYLFIPEGDTPTFLYLIQNGLGHPEHPHWGSWGGRYALGSLTDDSRHYGDVADRVVGKNGRTFHSNQATVWRWRDAFQNDFAARIQWTLKSDFEQVNHAPCVDINGTGYGPEPLHIEAEAGNEVILDASKTFDPDANDSLTYKWIHYREPTASQWWVEAEVGLLSPENIDNEVVGRKVRVTLPAPARCAMDLHTRQPKEVGQELHLILEVKDNGTPQLTAYKRVIIQCTNRTLSTEAGPDGDPMREIHEAIAKMQAGNA